MTTDKMAHSNRQLGAKISGTPTLDVEGIQMGRTTSTLTDNTKSDNRIPRTITTSYMTEYTLNTRTDSTSSRSSVTTLVVNDDGSSLKLADAETAHTDDTFNTVNYE